MPEATLEPASSPGDAAVPSFFSLDAILHSIRNGKSPGDFRRVLPPENDASPDERRLSLAVQGSRAGIWDWDLDNRQAFYSPIYRHLLGYGESDPFDGNIETFEKRLHPEERDRIREILAAHLENRAPYDFEFRMATRSGDYQWFRNRGQAFWDETGRPVRMLGTIHEISERRRILAELAQRERKFRSVIETAASVIVGVAPDGTIFEWNSEAERVLGRSRDEAVGNDYLELAVPLEFRDEMRRQIRLALGGESVRHLEGPVLNRAGGSALLLWNISPLLDARDRATGTIHIGLDVTRRKLEEQELQQSRRLKAVGELAAGVAHEFNNLLTPMMMHVQSVAEQLSGQPALQGELKQVDLAIQAAADLVARIVRMSKPAADKLEPLCLSTVIDETVGFLGKTLDGRIRIVTDLELGPTPSLLDRAGIAQVLINLVLNARDALLERLAGSNPPDWVPTIRIGTKAGTPRPDVSGRFQQFYVTDNGRGMSEDVRQRAFQPFFTTKGPRRGTGLGLAAVWSFVESMQGFVDLESKEGNGTTFRVSLPFQTTASAPSATAEAEGTGIAPPPARHPRVLYVEDDDFVAGAVAASLERGGFSITRKGDGPSGLRTVIEAPDSWDLVLTDLNMPDFSGLDLIRALRAQGHQGKIAVLSGMVSEEHRRQLIELGVAAILSKPIPPRELVAKTWEILEGTSGNWEI